MLSVTGMIEENSEYTGAKRDNSFLKKNGIDDRIIVNTCTTFIDIDTVKYDSYPSCQKIGTGDGIIIRPNEGSAIVIQFGQKMRFTPTEIKFVGMKLTESDKKIFSSRSKYYCRPFGRKIVYKVSNKIEEGKDKNEWDDFCSRSYWAMEYGIEEHN